MLLAASRTILAVFACSSAKPLCTQTLDDTPGKYVLLRFSVTMSTSVRSERLVSCQLDAVNRRSGNSQLSWICSLMSNYDRVLGGPVANIVCPTSLGGRLNSPGKGIHNWTALPSPPLVVTSKSEIAEHASVWSDEQRSDRECNWYTVPPHDQSETPEQYAALANCSYGSRDDTSLDERVVTDEGSMNDGVLRVATRGAATTRLTPKTKGKI